MQNIITLSESKILASWKTVATLPSISVEKGLYMQFCQESIINVIVFKMTLGI